MGRGASGLLCQDPRPSRPHPPYPPRRVTRAPRTSRASWQETASTAPTPSSQHVAAAVAFPYSDGGRRIRSAPCAGAPVTIGDFGCAGGANEMAPMALAIDTLRKRTSHRSRSFTPISRRTISARCSRSSPVPRATRPDGRTSTRGDRTHAVRTVAAGASTADRMVRHHAPLAEHRARGRSRSDLPEPGHRPGSGAPAPAVGGRLEPVPDRACPRARRRRRAGPRGGSVTARRPVGGRSIDAADR